MKKCIDLVNRCWIGSIMRFKKLHDEEDGANELTGTAMLIMFSLVIGIFVLSRFNEQLDGLFEAIGGKIAEITGYEK